MAIKECPNATESCKYSPNCFSDTHHIYGRGRGLGKLAMMFCNLPENKTQICRALHDEINATYVHLPLPSLDFMCEAIRRAKDSGKRTQRK